MNASGLRSPPPPPRSDAASPRPKFDTDLLKAYIKKLLHTTLQSSSWPEPKERDRVKAWIKEIGERVKERMVEIQPRGYKYIVLTQINENLGQGGRADMSCHWEDTDVVAQEMFSNPFPDRTRSYASASLSLSLDLNYNLPDTLVYNQGTDGNTPLSGTLSVVNSKTSFYPFCRNLAAVPDRFSKIRKPSITRWQDYRDIQL